MGLAEESRESGDDSIAARLAAAPPSDPPGLSVARGRIAAAVFDDEVTPAVGRFRILERLGAGGMGVVYAAYDPDLDRAVALKRVRVRARDRRAALAEAVALARLAHPNVVPVHEAGVVGDDVYIVMELVRGETLRAWAKGRDRRDILAVYAQVGEGLIAAHAAGLVHRDIKPDNALIGDDGRVRIVDFGLACEVSHAAAAAGTPRYMAPEQATGAATPAADQYSFCVALAEALATGDAPVPRWIEAALARGRAPDPGARFASMRELLRALCRDPARRRRRAVAVATLTALATAAVTVAMTAAFAAGRSVPPEPAPCSGGPAALAQTWPATARAAAIARLAGLGPYGAALAPTLAAALDDHASRWIGGHRDACVAHRRGAQSADLLDRRMACLERGRAALGEVALLVGGATAATLPAVALAAGALPDPDACADLAALLARTPPPPPALATRAAQVSAAIGRARIEIAAGRVPEARAAALRALAAARALGHAPLVAEALVTAGRAAMDLDTRGAALPELAEAVTTAIAAGDDALAVEAWARRLWIEGTSATPSSPASDAAFGDVIDALAARLPTAHVARALLHNNRGVAALAQGQRDRARAEFVRALADSRDVAGPDAVELISVRSNLALVTDDDDRRDALFGDAVAALQRRVGAGHPRTLEVALIRGATTVDVARARARLTPVCADYVRLHPTLAEPAIDCWVEVAFLAAEHGDRAGAAEAAARAAAIRDPRGDATEAAADLALWRGEPRAADRYRTALAALAAPAADLPWWDLLRRARLELGLGRALRAAGDDAGARAVLAPAVTMLSSLARQQPTAWIERQLARARAELVFAGGGDAAIARDAATWLRRAGGRGDELARLDGLASGR